MITAAFNRGRMTSLFTETLRGDTQINFRNNWGKRNGKEQRRGRAGGGKRKKEKRGGQRKASMIQVTEEKSWTLQLYQELTGIANSEIPLSKAG